MFVAYVLVLGFLLLCFEWLCSYSSWCLWAYNSFKSRRLLCVSLIVDASLIKICVGAVCLWLYGWGGCGGCCALPKKG